MCLSLFVQDRGESRRGLPCRLLPAPQRRAVRRGVACGRRRVMRLTGLRRAVFDYIEGWYNTRRLSRGVLRVERHPG